MYTAWHAQGSPPAAIFFFFAAHIAVSGFVLTPLFLSVLTANFFRAVEWEAAHAARLVDAAIARLRGGRGAPGFGFWAISDAAADDAQPGALCADSPGPFARRRRLDSIVSLAAIDAAARDIEADMCAAIKTALGPAISNPDDPDIFRLSRTDAVLTNGGQLTASSRIEPLFYIKKLTVTVGFKA